METRSSILDFKTLGDANVVRVESSKYNGGPTKHSDTIENSSRHYTHDCTYSKYAGIDDGKKVQLFSDRPVDINAYPKAPNAIETGIETELDKIEQVAHTVVTTSYDDSALSHDEVVCTIMDYVYDNSILPKIVGVEEDEEPLDQEEFEEEEFNADDYCED